MKQTLPWNVNGIPPEAREIARSAAQREGLSVGDWLTRRILGSGPPPGAEAQAQAPFRHERDEEPRYDRDDLITGVARSEAEKDSAFRRIDEALRTMTRRLESTERSQNEAHRAMSSAASEINAATREQALAFIHLHDRMDKVERHADTTALRDAVRGLHQGLSRLADQIGRTSHESTGQIAMLAGNVETMAGKIVQAREETAKLGHFVEIGLTSLSERLSLAENRIGSDGRLDATILALQEERQASTARLDEISARLQERNDAGAQLERTVGRLEERIAAGSWLEEAVARLDEERVASGARLDEIVAKLDERLFAGARLEESVARLEAERADSGALLKETLGKLEDERLVSSARLEEAVAKLEAKLDAKLEDKLGDSMAAERAASHALFEETVAKLESRMVSGEAFHDRIAYLESRIDAQAAKFDDKLVRLDARVVAGAQIEDTVAKLETRLNSAEERVQEAMGRHLASIERNLENIAQRLEQAERRGGEADGSVRESLLSLGQRFEAADRKTRDALSELHTSLGATAKRVDAIEPPISLTEPMPGDAYEIRSPANHAPAAHLSDISDERAKDDAAVADLASALSEPPGAAMPGLDLPPFPDAPPFPTGGFTSPPPGAEFTPSVEDAEGFGPEAASDAVSGTTLDYLAQARRAAQAADPAAPRGSRTPFSLVRGEGGDTAESEDAGGKNKSWFTRPVTVAAGIVLVLSAGFVVSRGLSGRHEVAATAPRGQVALNTQAAPGTKPAAKPAETDSPSETNSVAEAARNSANQVASLSGPNAILAPAPKTPEAPKADTKTNPGETTATTAQNGPPLARLTAKANAGDVKAELLLGIKYADGDGVQANDSQAVSWLKKAAAAGQPVAQYRLGTLYEKGRGVAVDAKQAATLYGEAARHGNRKAMHNLAVAYADGAGQEKNYTEAARWFKSAADLGLTDSQFNLAVLYERGLGVQASLGDAYKWYAVAAAAGDMESKARVDALATQLQPAAKEAADKAAMTFKPAPMNPAANDSPTMAQVAP